MKRDEVLSIIKARRQANWKSWFMPWRIQDDLLFLADYIEENDNPFCEPAPAPQVDLQRLADERLRALNAMKAWVMATFGTRAAFGPARDLLQDKFTISLKQK